MCSNSPETPERAPTGISYCDDREMTRADGSVTIRERKNGHRSNTGCSWAQGVWEAQVTSATLRPRDDTSSHVMFMVGQVILSA